MSMLLIALLQASPAATPPPERFSILVPIADEPCRPREKGDAEPADVTVCGNALKSQRLPYPNEVEDNRPQPSNPHMTGARALELQNTPCAARADGCQGAGIPILGMALWAGKLLVDAVGDVTKAKPDKSKRVAIPLDDPVPVKAP